MAQGTDPHARVLDEIASHPSGPAIVELVHTLAVSAFDERRASLDHGLDEAAARVGVEEASANTTFGNVIEAVRHGHGAGALERTLLGALVACGFASTPPRGLEAERRVAEALAWLSAHTIADPLGAFETAFPEGATQKGLLAALADLVREHAEGKTSGPDRASAVLAALTLARSTSKDAAELRADLAEKLHDPMLAAIVRPRGDAPAPAPRTGELVLSGEEASLPRGPVATFFLTVTLLLPIVSAAKLFGRVALRLRQPAELSFTKEGVTVRSRLELLGKVIRERETFLATTNLVRAAREVRYPRLATYVGIACLLFGSFFGLRHMLEGLRAGSPEFLALGIGVLVLALAIDYALSHLPARAVDRCRIVLEPRRGRVVSVARVDKKQADEALASLRG